MDKLPPRIQYAYWFQAFNAVSWQICLGSPLILFARELGAPAVVLGLLAGLAPLTSVLQLLVAPYAERIGYRRLMVSGWTARVITLMVLVALPLMVDVLSPAVVIAATVGVIFLFTTLRGIAMCAWLPWITAIVPRSLRGFYLSRDRAFISLASVAALAVSGLFLFDHRGMAPYSIVFGLGFLGGVVSLYFLNRIPEPPLLRREQVERTQTRAGAGWGALLRSPGFAQLVLFSATAQVVVLSSGAFVTVFAREEVRLSDGAILWATAASSLVGAVALALLRNRIDALGSRPFLGLVFLWWVAYDALWLALALSPTRSPLLAIATLSIAGFFGSIYDLALTRLLMNTVGDQPETTRYFALHSVIVSLLNGVAPMLWGAVLDWARSVQVGVADLLLNGYSLFFALQGILLIGVFWSLLRVHEPNAASTRQVLRGAIEQAPRELKRRFQLRR
ncbi:MAG: MFS transporter [Anaerolineae bacterium]|nr:MFS transporter [Thermoflexales bacterium]MDW8407149.1 MFS transporter [Anaerolineae bacterium]